jgi:hypothetical protein
MARSVRRACLAIIGGVALQSLSFVHDVPPALAQASQATSRPTRPEYQLGSAGRFNEDWSVLRGIDLHNTDDFWDRLKFIPLTPDQNVWLTIGGQVRERGEYFHQFLFGESEPKQSDGYLLSRFRLLADLHVTPYFRVFAEGKSSFALDRDLQGGRTTTYVDELDLFNGFADIMIPFGEQASVTLRGGRQELIFGSQRLVGPGDFSQIPKAFDGAAAYVRVRDWTVIPFWTMAVPIVHKYDFNKSTSDLQFFGVFGSGPLYVLPVNLDLYWLDAANRTATFNGTTGRERRHTLGGRVSGKISDTDLDFEVEGAAQFGTVGRGNIAASMSTVVLGYTLSIARLSPRVYVGFDYASGDDKPGGNVGTFNQLYPDAHTFLGYIDYIGRQNVISPNAGIKVSPIPGLTLSLQQYFFWRASDRDAVYNKTGGVLRAGTSRARYVGADTDLYAAYDFARHLLGYAGYSRFFAGDFIRQTGPHKDSDFFYAAIEYTF